MLRLRCLLIINNSRKFSSKAAYFHQPSSSPFLYRTLGQHFEIAVEKYGNSDAIVASQENVRLTFAEALQQADILASKFRYKLNLKKGDHIALWGPNTVQWYLSFLAASRAGLVSVCLNPALQDKEIKYCLKKSKVKSVIVPESFKSQKYYEILKRLAPEMSTSTTSNHIQCKALPNLKTIIVDSKNNSLSGAIKFKDLFSNPNESQIDEIRNSQDMNEPDDPYIMQFTSGTTGKPKAAIVSNFSLVNLTESFHKRSGFNQNDRNLCQLPLFHAFGMMTLISTFTSGSALVLPSIAFDSVETLKAIEKEKCTILYGTPTMFVDNIEKQKNMKINVDSLKVCITGGAACSPEVFKEVKKVFGFEKMINGYGLSEATCAVFMQNGNEDIDKQLNSVGHLYDNLEVKTIDENGKIVEFGQEGELCVRGYTTMLGYFEDEEKTRECLTNDGWLKTGFYSKQLAYVNQIGSSPLLYQTIGEQIEISAEKFGNREAIVSYEDNQRLTYTDALNKADIIASKLRNLGLQRGDHLALWAPNSNQWYLSFLAALRAGLVLVCINPALQGQEIKYCLKKARVKALITPDFVKAQKYYEILTQVLPEIQNSKTISCMDLPEFKTLIVDSINDRQGAYKFQDMLSNPDSIKINEIRKSQNIIDPDSPCNIQFTSGTTGQPKAAILTHFNFINSSKIYGIRTGLESAVQRIMCQVPFFHVFGLTTLLASIMNGSTLIVPSPTFNSEATLKAIDEEKCTIIIGTPTMLVDNLEKQKNMNSSVDSLKLGITGGAACSPQVYKNFKKTFGLDQMKIAYGLSEATAAVYQQNGNEEEEISLNTVEQLFDNLEAKIIDSDGKTVKFGESGELCLRGYCNMKGYFEDEMKTKEVLGKDNWLKTGDQFILHENGYAQIVGRKKDMIIRGGENIFPKEIEDFLDTHPDILESQVIGIPDPKMGEEICAFVRLKSDVTDITRENIKTFSKGKIAHFKIPRYVQVVKEFPKTTSGKIQKFKLKDIFEGK